MCPVDDVEFPLDHVEDVEDEFEDFPLDGEETDEGDDPHVVDFVLEEDALQD